MKLKMAKYRCVDKDCKHEWTVPTTANTGACPKCGGLYYRWLNYDKLFPRDVQGP